MLHHWYAASETSEWRSKSMKFEPGNGGGARTRSRGPIGSSSGLWWMPTQRRRTETGPGRFGSFSRAKGLSILPNNSQRPGMFSYLTVWGLAGGTLKYTTRLGPLFRAFMEARGMLSTTPPSTNIRPSSVNMGGRTAGMEQEARMAFQSGPRRMTYK